MNWVARMSSAMAPLSRACSRGIAEAAPVDFVSPRLAANQRWKSRPAGGTGQGGKHGKRCCGAAGASGCSRSMVRRGPLARARLGAAGGPGIQEANVHVPRQQLQHGGGGRRVAAGLALGRALQHPRGDAQRLHGVPCAQRARAAGGGRSGN